MRIHSLSDNFTYIGFIVFSLRRCCLDIRAGSWISLISFCDVSITESLSTSVFSFFFFYLFFSPCSQSQWFLCLLLACLVCVSASALPELADYRAISVKARRLPEFCPCFCVWPFLWREFRHDLSHRLVFQMVIVLLHGAGCSFQLLFSFFFFIFL